MRTLHVCCPFCVDHEGSHIAVCNASNLLKTSELPLAAPLVSKITQFDRLLQGTTELIFWTLVSWTLRKNAKTRVTDSSWEPTL
uniref:Uncharacterized protein n=1 Tax=Anguilla anguilla TaxID=7936 RepID=A0A0E9WP76_ANGAN